MYLKDYTTPKEARRSLAAYFDFYNHRRRHQALDDQTPASIYFAPPAVIPDQESVALAAS